jgi:preprotein translocase subunit SecG
MELVVLLIHLVVSVCLIGLVLLQRSEGGALGMGGGGGSLMSGRGAADALARMTSVAGGFFLVTSLGLTVLSGAAATNEGRSVFDLLPQTQSAPAAPAPAAPATPAPETPDPTESSAPQASDTQLASITPGPAQAAAATPNTTNVPPPSTTRAGPLDTRPAAQPASTQRTGTTPASAASGQTTRAPALAQRSTAGTTQPSSGTNTRPLVIPDTSGAVSGVNLTDDPAAESSQTGGLEAVRRERAGPDQ